MKHITSFVLVAAFMATSFLFAAAPAAKEFVDGKRQKFSTAGHAKAKGLDMTISYPSSWAAKEGERPNIVQKFVSEGGRGLEIAAIITKSLQLSPDTTLTESDLKEFFTPAELKTVMPDGAKFIHARQTRIEGLPAGILEYSIATERAGMTIDMQVISFIVISGTTLAQFQGHVAAPGESSSALAERMAEFKPVFTLMANSIVLQDKWR